VADGPVPKENSIRRNRADLAHLEPPEDVPDRLKKLRNASTYSAFTQEWWGVWVNSPQAEIFFATDWMALQRLAMLIEAFVKRPGHNAAAEIRQQESLFGATVMDRMRMKMPGKGSSKGPEELPEDVANFMDFMEKKNS
jgi:hypothetical protein